MDLPNNSCSATPGPPSHHRGDPPTGDICAGSPESKTEHSRNNGPLRRLFEDMNHLNRRMHDMEDKVNAMSRSSDSAEKYSYTHYPDKKYAMTASQAMAAQIDQEVLNLVQGLK